MPFKNRVPRVCSHCGGTFLAEPRKGPRAAKFCSRGCAWDGLRLSTAGQFASRSSEPRGLHGCIEWTGPRLPSGYGTLGGHRYAHRVAWELAHGQIPAGMVVRHLVCDNPPCVRVDHLALGTHLDNMADMRRAGRSLIGDRNPARAYSAAVRKGEREHPKRPPERIARGERISSAKLNAEQVIEIRARFAAGGMSHRALAREFGVTRLNVLSIVNRKTWKHLL